MSWLSMVGRVALKIMEEHGASPYMLASREREMPVFEWEEMPAFGLVLRCDADLPLPTRIAHAVRWIALPELEPRSGLFWLKEDSPPGGWHMAADGLVYLRRP